MAASISTASRRAGARSSTAMANRWPTTARCERVGVVPEQIPPEQAAGILAELSELTDIRSPTSRSSTAQADPSWFVPIKDFPAEEKERLLDIISRLPGVSVKSEMARVYPLGQRAAHITGYIAEPTAEQIAANPALDSRAADRAGRDRGRGG